MADRDLLIAMELTNHSITTSHHRPDPSQISVNYQVSHRTTPQEIKTTGTDNNTPDVLNKTYRKDRRC